MTQGKYCIGQEDLIEFCSPFTSLSWFFNRFQRRAVSDWLCHYYTYYIGHSYTAKSVYYCVWYFYLAIQDYNGILCGFFGFFLHERISKPITTHSLHYNTSAKRKGNLTAQICDQFSVPERILVNNTLCNMLLKTCFIKPSAWQIGMNHVL